MEQFNPIKEEDGKKAKRIVWSTATLNKAIDGLKRGRKLVANPFYENNIKLLKGDLLFERTPEEVEEWKKCKDDILYFVEKYVKFLTPEGIKNIKLRDYQKEYLRHLENCQLSVFLAARQVGKCNSFSTNVLVNVSKISCKIGKRLKKYQTLEGNFMLPFFELYGLIFGQTQRYHIYRNLYETYDNKLWKILDQLDSKYDDCEKIIESAEVKGIEVWTETGWKPITHLHRTKRLDSVIVKTKNHELTCADTHILMSESGQIYAEESLGCDIKTINGTEKVISVAPDRKQSMFDITVDSDEHTYYTNGILSHNTTTTGAFLLHYVCFNFDKNTMVLGNKRKTAVEILDKMKKMFVEIPFFLKPGIYKWNEGEIAFDNVCRIQAEATTANSGIGQTLACVIWDEAAHVAPNIIDKFYTNIFPTITAANAKFLISSTQNGRNLFYRIYKAAERGESDYKPFKTDWYEVPDWDEVNHCWVKRDENWHQRQIANYGSEEAFNSQFGTDFDLGSNTLISNKVLKRLGCVKFVNKDLPGVSYNECWYWHPEYDPMNLKQERILTTCDLAEGVGQDYTVFSIYRIINQKLECIGYFRSNQVIRKDCARSLMELYTKWVSQGCGLISLEYNTYGEIFINEMHYLADSELPTFDDYCIIKYYSENGRNYRLGIKLNSANKSAYCKLFKESIEQGGLINEAEDFVFELQNFSDTGNGHYKASFGHDDMVMTGVQVEFAKQTLQYKILYDEAQTQATTPDTIWNPYSSNNDVNYWNPYNQTLY